MQLYPPEAVTDIARRLQAAGFQAWAVGGAVRDALLGNPHSDWDLATSARPEDVRRIFRRTVPVGIEHGTVGVLARDGVLYEVTTFRRDVATDGRHATVAFADTLEEDLARRDFTINAIAWHPLTEELRDPHGGMQDLRDAVLRTVGAPAERFAEDYLRVLRALRFAGHYVLTIDPPTWTALVAAVPGLGGLSAERVREELVKILTKTRHASAPLKLYAASGALRALLPELHALIGFTVSAGGGAAADVWEETLTAVDALARSRPRLRLAALLHAVGMPAARTRDLRGGWRVTGHETAGARRAADVMQRLRASNAETEDVTRLVRLQNELFPPDAPPALVRRWLAEVEPGFVPDLFRLRFALWRARPVAGGAADLVERWRMVRRVLRERPPLAVSDLALDGSDLKQLGLRPGPEFGIILRRLLERVWDEPALNERERLLHIVRTELLP
ncbi:MAG TPA: CCA tRNA nucleotidyltransferase [Longimicrobiales bacterium]|nr:CCA tRNA nucleotidyltransferase [Longimicrobiales bacterium]